MGEDSQETSLTLHQPYLLLLLLLKKQTGSTQLERPDREKKSLMEDEGEEGEGTEE